MGDLLTVSSVSLSFGGLTALDHVDLTVAEGSIAGLIGPNGAGKTSLLNCICGFYQPQRGSIRLGGVELPRAKPHTGAARGLARTFQHMELFGTMSVLDNTLVGSHTLGRPWVFGEALLLPSARTNARKRREGALTLLDRLGLTPYASVAARDLPLGLQKRTGLARALASGPRLLLLDEPAGGLNEREKRELAVVLARLRADLGIAILLIEHDMDLVMGLCDAITVLDFGRKIASGPPDLIQRDPAVIAAYLGVIESRAAAVAVK
jgi:branched-chain amino acid transport system ATP-binding protein